MRAVDHHPPGRMAAHIPDFGRIAWAERRMVIAFDSDVTTNAARLELARHLIHERGAQVHFLEIPGTVADGKTGIDDLLASVGPEKALNLIDRAKRAGVREKRTPILESVFGDVKFFHTSAMKPYATLVANGHREKWPTRTQGIRNWL